VLRFSNGTLKSYGPGAYPGFLSVVTASGSQYWLPASSPAGGSVTITLSFRQPVQVQAASLVLQSGDAVAAVAASPYSYYLLAQQQGGSSASGQQERQPLNQLLPVSPAARRLLSERAARRLLSEREQ